MKDTSQASALPSNTVFYIGQQWFCNHIEYLNWSKRWFHSKVKALTVLQQAAFHCGVTVPSLFVQSTHSYATAEHVYLSVVSSVTLWIPSREMICWHDQQMVMTVCLLIRWNVITLNDKALPVSKVPSSSFHSKGSRQQHRYISALFIFHCMTISCCLKCHYFHLFDF